MKHEVSDKLIQHLSLYLDKELQEEEMIEIEELLKIDSEVSEIFDSLKRTRQVLRSAPKIKRRKSFTLSPEHAKQTKKENNILNGMRFVSSFAMILLLVVITQSMLGDWLPLGSTEFVANNIENTAAYVDVLEIDLLSIDSEKTSGDADDTVSDDQAELSIVDQESSGAEERDVEETYVDSVESYSTDQALVEGERVKSPENVLGGGDIAPEAAADLDVEDAEDVVVGEGVTQDTEILVEEQDLEGEADLADLEDEELEGEIEDETMEVDAEAIVEVVDDVEDSNDLTFLIGLALFAILSSGIYLILRKKYG